MRADDSFVPIPGLRRYVELGLQPLISQDANGHLAPVGVDITTGDLRHLDAGEEPVSLGLGIKDLRVSVAARVVVPGIPADLAVAFATLNIRHYYLLRLDRVRRRKSCLGLGWVRPGSAKPAVRVVQALAGATKFLADGAAPKLVMCCGSSSPTCARTREFRGRHLSRSKG